jgi:hypothetical protein
MASPTPPVASSKTSCQASIQFMDGNNKTDQLSFGGQTIDVQMWDASGMILRSSGATTPASGATASGMAIGGEFLNTTTGAVSRNFGTTTSATLVETGGMKNAVVTITSAQLLALHTTPISVIAAPGAGLAIDVVSCVLTYHYNTTAYTINGSTNLTLNFTNASGAAITTTLATTGLIDQTANVSIDFKAVTTNVTMVVNAAVVFCLAAANPTLGDGTLVLNVLYRIVTV